ncbi:MAG: UDP-2,4-diacetamido-2,4,6-trideoxy-beta-L-altropyranose hydrolase [Syntrophales bacterium]
MNLSIRADADSQIGTGHIMRCIALAQGWQDQGGKVTFLSHCESGALRERISKEGFKFVKVETPHPNPDDLVQTIAYLKLKRPSPRVPYASTDWFVLDGYHFSPEYQRAVRDAGIRLLVIDDMNHLPYYHADFLLNQNIYAPELEYRCDEDTALLLGTHYVLLRREFLGYRNFKRQIPARAKNILVTLGGGDSDNVTLKVIKSLKPLDKTDFSVKIVIGPANPHQESLRKALSATFFNSELLINPINMPELMAWAELAISAGGSTCWELAFMGLPCLLFILSNNQEPIVSSLNNGNAAQNLGWYCRYDFSKLSDLMFSLISDIEVRKAMSDNSKVLIDGRGSLRVCESMMGGRI